MIRSRTKQGEQEESGKGAMCLKFTHAHAHTHFPESSFRGMMIYGRDYRKQMECAPRKGATNLRHRAAACTTRVMSPKRPALHDLLQAAAD